MRLPFRLCNYRPRIVSVLLRRVKEDCEQYVRAARGSAPPRVSSDRGFSYLAVEEKFHAEVTVRFRQLDCRIAEPVARSVTQSPTLPREPDGSANHGASPASHESRVRDAPSRTASSPEDKTGSCRFSRQCFSARLLRRHMQITHLFTMSKSDRSITRFNR